MSSRACSMSRFLAWLVLAVAGGFLVVASQSFSLSVISSLTFAISIGTLVVSAGVVYLAAPNVPAMIIGISIGLISAWTIVASVVFTQQTVQTLALGASLAISGLAIVGLTGHEITLEHAVESTANAPADREGRLAAAA